MNMLICPFCDKYLV